MMTINKILKMKKKKKTTQCLASLSVEFIPLEEPVKWLLGL